ncbi:unnamed protein product [Gongylonema pulchrum]|uniref:Uncharacterized protein n=1 Tax=Gongylonema pulchrum TaxID=637853 RepID=A0A3P7NX72_9BILA|nr:unnamed protein product [Gongylonema pulchrum]
MAAGQHPDPTNDAEARFQYSSKNLLRLDCCDIFRRCAEWLKNPGATRQSEYGSFENPVATDEPRNATNHIANASSI